MFKMNKHISQHKKLENREEAWDHSFIQIFTEVWSLERCEEQGPALKRSQLYRIEYSEYGKCSSRGKVP